MTKGNYKYRLKADLHHKTLGVGPRFRNAWLYTRPTDGAAATALTVSLGYAWDGCTMAPDARGTKQASCLHDAIYQFAESIVAANPAWTVRSVLSWGDSIFLERMLADGARPWVAHLYYRAVSLCGYTFHMAARRILGPAELRTKRRRAHLTDHRSPITDH